MESTPGEGTPPSAEPGPEIDIPATPVPRRDELWANVPFALLYDTLHSIGWQNWREKKGGLQFVTLRLGRFGMYKPVNRYPMTDEGWAGAWRELTVLDAAVAERVRQKLEQRAAASPAPPPEPVIADDTASADREPWYVRMAKNASNTYPHLGVRISNGEIYPNPTMGRPAIGPLKGAHAEITDPTKAQMVRAGLASGLALGPLIGPFALAPGLLRKSKAVAFVVCPNGNVHEHKLDGTAAIRAGQKAAVGFNARAGPEVTPTLVSPQQPAPAAPADRLAEVARLHDHGLLSDEEYEAKRAEIIGQL
jgi:Short C-terminal domain